MPPGAEQASASRGRDSARRVPPAAALPVALILALVLPLVVVWPFRHHPPAALALKELVFQICMLGAVFAAGARGIRAGVFLRPTVLFALAWTLWLWLSASLSSWPADALRTAALGTTLALLVAAGAAASDGSGSQGTRSWTRVPRAVNLAAGAIAVYFLAQWLIAAVPGGLVLGPSFDLTTDGPSATFANRNQLATLFVFAWPGALVLFPRRGPAGKALAVVLLGALACTGTEGAWLGALAALLFLLWRTRPGEAPASVSGPRVRRTAGGLLALLVIGGIVGVGAVALGGTSMAGSLPRTPAVLERAALWNIACRGTAAAPLLGAGPGTFDHVVRRHQADLLTEPAWEGVEYLSLHAHNDALEAAATLGVPGLLLLAALLLIPLVRTGMASPCPPRVAALGAGLLGILIHGLVHYPLEVAGVRALAFASAGLLAGAAGATASARPGRLLRGSALWIPGLLLCLPGLLVSVQHARATGYLDRGLAAGEEGRLEASELAFRQAARSRPDWGVAWNGLGTARTLRGDLHGAGKAMERARELAPDDPEILANAATVSVLMGERPRGADLYGAALRINPLHVPSLRGLARLREDEGRREEALSLYRKAVALEPGDQASQDGVRRLTGSGDDLPRPSNL